MLLFLAGVVEQLDLALEHIRKADVHDARFGLMLTDNVLELVLHQIVEEKRAEVSSWRYRENSYPHQALLKKAFLGSFSDKLAFARADGGLAAEALRTIKIMHEYRNDVYHAGLKHEEILPALARFYFDSTCGFVATYNPRGLGWGSGQELPERAKKYFAGSSFLPGSHEDFVYACKAMAAACGHDPEFVVGILANDLERIVDQLDTCVQIVADGVYEGQQTTRDQAVIETQAWDFAFGDAGKAYLAENEFQGSILDAIAFLSANYSFKYKRDPIAGWGKQVTKLRSTNNPHLALAHYQSFIKETGSLRSALEQSASAAEAEIDAAIDRMRGK